MATNYAALSPEWATGDIITKERLNMIQNRVNQLSNDINNSSSMLDSEGTNYILGTGVSDRAIYTKNDLHIGNLKTNTNYYYKKRLYVHGNAYFDKSLRFSAFQPDEDDNTSYGTGEAQIWFNGKNSVDTSTNPGYLCITGNSDFYGITVHGDVVVDRNLFVTNNSYGTIVSNILTIQNKATLKSLYLQPFPDSNSTPLYGTEGEVCIWFNGTNAPDNNYDKGYCYFQKVGEGTSFNGVGILGDLKVSGATTISSLTINSSITLGDNVTIPWSKISNKPESAAASGGNDSTLITTGERYSWNQHVTNKGAAFVSGLYKITTNGEGHVTGASAVTKADITNLGIPAQDTTYTIGTGLVLNNNTISHASAITAQSTQKLYSITINDTGHVISCNNGYTVITGEIGNTIEDDATQSGENIPNTNAVINYINGKNYLIASDIENKLDIPELPENNGTYTLQLTMNNGTATYEWIASEGE